MAGSERNQRVDALKFFAISLVPLQHLLNLRDEFRLLPGAHALVGWMVSFDMPLFVFLSGYVLFGREAFGRPVTFLRRKALGLLVPYFAWITVEMLVERLPLSQWPAKLGTAAIQPHQAYQMWFLWVLFALFVVFTLASLASRSDWWFAGIGVAFEAARLLPPTTVAGIDKILLLMPFLMLGYLVSKHREALRRYDIWIAIVAVPTFAVVSFVPQDPLPLQVIASTSGIATCWALYRLMPRRLIAAQAWVGRKSLGIYAGQMVMLPLVLVGAPWGYVGVALSEVTTMTASGLLAWALEQTAWTRRVFLGAWPKPRPKGAVAPAEQPEATTPAEGM